VSAYSLDESLPGAGLTATVHSFRAGADWREPEWTGPPLVVGDARPATGRHGQSARTVAETAQWMHAGRRA